MAESRPVFRPWQPEDPLEAVRLQAMQDLAESAQLSAASPNVHIHKSPNAGTSIMVDAPPPPPPAFLKFVRLKTTGDGVYSAYVWTDTSMEGDPLGVGLQPSDGRELGTSVDFVAYASKGEGYFDDDTAKTFILVRAWGEKYATRPCAETP